MAVLSMTWRDVLYAHWSVPPSLVADRLPPALSVDTYEGEAYLGVVTFEMADVGPPHSPVGATFPELNLRTYVTAGGDPGVYFFTLDADDRLGVALARSLFRLPYHSARMDLSRRGRETHLRSRRADAGPPATVDIRYEPTGSPFQADPGSLEGFLTERYRFYTASDAGDPGRPTGRVHYADIDHDPWTLRRANATFAENDLFEACGFEAPTGEPHLLYGRRARVSAGRLRRL